jgi:hypothetical protein
MTTRHAIDELPRNDSHPAFRRLATDEDWRQVPSAVRRRFACVLGPGETAVYVGQS